MQRIATATKAVDLYGVGKHGFKDGNLALGITPTDFEAAWANGLQEEVLSVIEVAGLVPSGATLNQLLTALRSAGVFNTPTQFDNTTKAATTAFVQRALGNYQKSYIVTSAVTLVAADAGAIVSINGGGSLVLPLAAASLAGNTFLICSTTAATVARQGADTINCGTSPNATSLVFGVGDSALIVYNGIQWEVFSGSVLLKNSAGLASSKAANGYQVLPSGVIINRGSAGASAAGDVAITFPLAFPTACRQIFTGVQITATDIRAGYNSPSVTGFNVNAWYSGGRANATVDYLAIGD